MALNMKALLPLDHPMSVDLPTSYEIRPPTGRLELERDQIYRSHDHLVNSKNNAEDGEQKGEDSKRQLNIISYR